MGFFINEVNMKLVNLTETILDVVIEHEKLTNEPLNDDTEVEFIEIPFYDPRIKITTTHNGKKFVYIRDVKEKEYE